MKTILLPTDFSLAAKNAARYAMHLAREMKADLKLCTAVGVPVEVPVPAQVSTSLLNVEALEHQAAEELKHFAQQITQLDLLEGAAEAYHPEVDYEVGIGPVSYVICELATNHDVSLVTMGMTGAGGLGQFLFGSNSQAMVEAATFPVLFVPSGASYRKLTKIAFATDLTEADIVLIHVLANFARTFNAEILLVHISDQLQDSRPAYQKKIDDFLREVTNKVNYHKIYYQHLQNDTVDDGLACLASHEQVQMLVMVHRKQNILYRLFKGSHTQTIKRHIEIPLMVFPPHCLPKVM